MSWWTFPTNIVSSIVQQCKVIVFESLRSSWFIKFWLFSTKNDDFYFKSKNKFPDCTDLKNCWIFRVFWTDPKQFSNGFENWNHSIDDSILMNQLWIKLGHKYEIMFKKFLYSIWWKVCKIIMSISRLFCSQYSGIIILECLLLCKIIFLVFSSGSQG